MATVLLELKSLGLWLQLGMKLFGAQVVTPTAELLVSAQVEYWLE